MRNMKLSVTLYIARYKNTLRSASSPPDVKCASTCSRNTVHSSTLFE